MPQPGAYRKPLIKGFRAMNQGNLANLLEDGDVKLAVASSIYGPVNRREDLTAPCIEALERAKAAEPERAEVCDHYIAGLRAGRTVPVSTIGVNAVYQDGRTTPTAGPDDDKVYAPGELFFST